MLINYRNVLFCIAFLRNRSMAGAAGIEKLGTQQHPEKLDKNMKTGTMNHGPFQNIWGNAAIAESG